MTSRWTSVPLKTVVGINRRVLAETTAPEFEFRYVDIGAVGRGLLVGEPQPMTFADAPSRARRLVAAGDTIMSTVRTYLRAVWPVRAADDPETLVASTGFAVLTPRQGLDPDFFSWFAQSDPFIEEVVSRSTGVSYPAINAADLGRFYVPMPALSEQRAIADLLATETFRIDALIDKKRRLLDLLGDRYRDLVDVVTSAGEPMRVRHLTALITSGPRGWADRVGDDGDPFIRSANLRRDSIGLRRENLLRVDAVPTREALRARVRSGDTVVGITGANTGWVGLVETGDAPAYVSQHVAILRPSGVHERWLALAVFSRRSQEALLAGQYGGTKQQLGLSDLADLVVCLPSYDDQVRLVARLDAARVRHEQLVSALLRQVDLLAERRRALITAAVTGAMAVAA